MRTLIEMFEASLEALAHGDHVKFREAIAGMHSAIGFYHAIAPSFEELLAAVEKTDIPDQTNQIEYDSTRMTEMAECRARRFYRDWRHDWDAITRDVLADEFRLAMEEARGETRQEPRPADPPPMRSQNLSK